MKTKKNARKKKPRSFFDLTPEERDRDAARFDRTIDLEREFRPLTAKERALHERIFPPKPHVSIHVNDSRREVKYDLDAELMAKAAEHARKKKISLPKMIDLGLRGYLACAGF